MRKQIHLLVGCLIWAVLTPQVLADPTKPRPEPTKSDKPKPPQQIEEDLFKQDMDAFGADLANVTKGGTEFIKVFDNSKPEEKAAGAALANQAKQNLAAANALAADAARLMKEAALHEGTVPTVARAERQQAREKLDWAKSKLEQAQAIYAPPPAVPDTPARPPLLDDRCKGLACRQLKKIVESGALGSDAGEFDLPQLPVDPPNRRKDPIFRGKFEAPPIQISPDGASIEIPGSRGSAQPFDLGPLKDAVADIDPAVARRPLIESCDGKPCPSRELLALLADRTKRDALRNIGGVSLDATFDVLALTGMSELRGGTELEFIAQPRLVSLRSLLERAPAYANNWDAAPEELRFPGDLGRVYGWVEAADGNDIFLVGAPAASPEQRIDIDALILTLRTIWRDGRAPAVSLDPRPDQIGGPQYPRIIDLPADSSVAALMLEADYAMKAINLGTRIAEGSDPIGLKSIYERIGASIEQGVSRFWLTPEPLRAENAYRSASGRTVLFSAQVGVKAEAMTVDGGQLLGAGSVGPLAAATAQAFTQAYPELERDPAVPGSMFFARMRGVTDLAVMARGLRNLQVDNPVLRGLAALPYRRLAGADAIPSVYAGLHGELRLGNRVFVHSGGAQLDANANLRDAPAFADHIGARLERMADGWKGELFADAADSFAVPQRAELSLPDAVDPRLAAARQLERGDWNGAASAYADYLLRNPIDAEAMRGLALAQMGAGRFGAAAAAIARAQNLEPEQRANSLLALDLAWRIDTSGALLDSDPDERAELSRHYAEIAQAAFLRNDEAAARRFAEWAVRLDRDNGEARLVLAFSYPPESQRAELEIAQAVRAFRKVAGDSRLGPALTVAAQFHLQRGAQAFADGRDGIFLVAQAEREAREAARDNPQLPAAHALGLVAAALVEKARRPNASMIETFGAEIDTVKARFPRDPDVILAVAKILVIDERFDEAYGLAGYAISVAPANPEAYALRAELAAQLGRCVQAADDQRKVLELAGGRAARLEFDQAPSACSTN